MSDLVALQPNFDIPLVLVAPQMAKGFRPPATRPRAWHPGGVAEDEGRLPFGPPDEEARAEARWWISHMRATLEAAREHRARQPCPECGIDRAVIVPSGGQNSVRCQKCGRHLYNAPKTETGEAPRTVRTLRRGVKPRQQARILDRDNRRCVLCGSGEGAMALGHLLSVEDGVAVGATQQDLYCDANLATMCEACNLGLGGRSVTPRSYAVIVLALIRAERRRQEADAVAMVPAAVPSASESAALRRAPRAHPPRPSAGRAVPEPPPVLRPAGAPPPG